MDKRLILFHGGCFECTQQELNGIEFCYNCQFFDADWNKPNLNNRPPTEAEVIRLAIKCKMERRLKAGENHE